MTHYNCTQADHTLGIYRGGDVYVCCPLWTCGPVGSILTTDPSELWRGDKVAEMRRHVADKTFSSCRQCPYLPAPSGPITEVQGEYAPSRDLRVHALAVAYDHTCNLACPTCRQQLFAPSPDETYTMSEITARLARSPLLELVDVMYLAGGGEPLASRHYQALVDSIDRSRCPNLRLAICTNGRLLDPERWERLVGPNRWTDGQTTVRELQVSLDAATDATYAQLRRDGSSRPLAMPWSNLYFIKSLREQELVDRVVLNFVVQAANYAEMPAFVRLAADLHADEIHFQKFLNWGTFDDASYRARAVHLRDHPMHQSFAEVLRDETMRSETPKVVWIGNLE